VTRRIARLRLLYAVAAVIFVAGCATTGRTPTKPSEPIAEMPAAEPEPQPVEPRSATDLLQAAREAFENANRAQEEGDHEAALRDYTLMLELLIEADVDPSAFYSLRSELARVLEVSSRGIEVARREKPAEWKPEELMPEISGLPMPIPPPPRVVRQIEKVQTLYPKNFQAGLDRAATYIPHLKAEFAKAGLPEDLVWLAMVESQFNPRAYSRAGAAGMWQFMSATGRRYGLDRDAYVDDRYNWHKATQAAIAYLTELYEMFDESWPLAVSAYNMGERGLERAIAAAGGERDFWRLLETRAADRHIRLETKEFYPKLCASILVAKNPERYGFRASTAPPMDIKRVAVKGHYSLEDLDRACGLPSGTLKQLNPDLLLGLTPPFDTYTLTVPASATERFQVALQSVRQLQPGFHIVKAGETPSQIAARYRVSTSELMRLNNVKSARRLRIGQRLAIPGRTAASMEGRSYTTSSGGRRVYTVRRGDCLYDIAKAEGVTIDNLKEWNNLTRTHIRIGEKLYVSPPGTGGGASTAPSGTKITHVVRKNEFPGGIAAKYGVRLADLLQWNTLTSRSIIRPGQKLVIYTAGCKLDNHYCWCFW